MYLVAWVRDAHPEPALTRGRLVRRDGTLPEDRAFDLVARVSAGKSFDLSAGPGNDWVVVGDRYANELPYRAPRAFLRTVSPK